MKIKKKDQIEEDGQGEEEHSVNGNSDQVAIQQEDNTSKSMEELPRNDSKLQEAQILNNADSPVAEKPSSGIPIDHGDTRKDNQFHNDGQMIIQLEGTKGIIMKEKGDKCLTIKTAKNQMTVKDVQAEDEDSQMGKGKDLDAESTTQNFMHVTRQGNISPRPMDKGRSAGRGKKRQTKEAPSVQAPGVQTRRTISKSIN